MEEDIKVLEKCIHLFKSNDTKCLSGFDIKALENLIKGYRELEKENIELKEHIHFKDCKNCGKQFKAKRSNAKYCKECGRKVNNSNYYKNLTEEQKQKRRNQAKISMRNIRKKKKEQLWKKI